MKLYYPLTLRVVAPNSDTGSYGSVFNLVLPAAKTRGVQTSVALVLPFLITLVIKSVILVVKILSKSVKTFS